MADELDRKGVGIQIFKDGNTRLRDAIKTEILYFILKVIDTDRLTAFAMDDLPEKGISRSYKAKQENSLLMYKE